MNNAEVTVVDDEFINETEPDVNNWTPWNKWFWGGLAVILIAVAVGYCSPKASAADLAELPKMNEQMFVPSVQLGNSSTDGFCSGTLISSERDQVSGDVETFILTAKHCVTDHKDGGDISVIIHNYNTENREINAVDHKAIVYGKSYKSDLALLKLKDKDTFFKTTAKIAPKDTKLVFGQDVWVVGYPLGLSQTLTSGVLGRVETVEPFSTYSQSRQFYRSTPDIAPGNSGGAMFQKNAKGDYEIIGVATGTIRGFTYINFYSPIEEINEYLSVALQKKSLAGPPASTLK